MWWYVFVGCTFVVSSSKRNPIKHRFSTGFYMKISQTLRSLKVIPLIIISTLFISCGGANQAFVSDVEVSSSLDNGELLVSFGADLALGDISISTIAIPVANPKNGKEIGLIQMFTDGSGKTRFEVDINASSIANIDSLVGKLPNGNMLPLVRQNNAIAIPVDGGRAHVYLAFSDGVAAIGASVAINGLDSVGLSIGRSSIFPSFNFDNVLGAAGLYTSPEAGKNGFALMVDISNVIDTDLLLGSSPIRLSSKSQIQSRSVMSISEKRDDVVLDHSSIRMSRSKKRRLNRKLFRLHRKKATL